MLWIIKKKKKSKVLRAYIWITNSLHSSWRDSPNTVLLQLYHESTSSSHNNKHQRRVYSKQRFVNGSRQTGRHTAPSRGEGTCEVISPAYNDCTLNVALGYVEERLHKLTQPDNTGHDNAMIPAADMVEQFRIKADKCIKKIPVLHSDFCLQYMHFCGEYLWNSCPPFTCLSLQVIKNKVVFQ